MSFPHESNAFILAQVPPDPLSVSFIESEVTSVMLPVNSVPLLAPLTDTTIGTLHYENIEASCSVGIETLRHLRFPPT